MDYRDKVGIFTAAILREPNILLAMAITYRHWDIKPGEPDNDAAWEEAKILAAEHNKPSEGRCPHCGKHLAR